MVAATHYGYEARILQAGLSGIDVELTSKSDVVKDNLFHQIKRRQTNRSVYDGRSITDLQLDKLRAIPRNENIEIYVAEIGSSFADTLAQYIGKGNAIQMGDKAFREELLSWMRFNGMQAKKSGDGLSCNVFGTPSLPEVIAKPIVRPFLKPNIQNKGDMKKIASSSHLLLLTTRHNTVEEWIELGRLLQRLLLTATELDIASAYCNQPCEVTELADELQKTLPIDGAFPTLILRIGYAEPMPYSLRKRVDEVIERQ